MIITLVANESALFIKVGSTTTSRKLESKKIHLAPNVRRTKPLCYMICIFLQAHNVENAREGRTSIWGVRSALAHRTIVQVLTGSYFYVIICQMAIRWMFSTNTTNTITYLAYSWGNGLEYQVWISYFPNSIAAGHLSWAAINLEGDCSAAARAAFFDGDVLGSGVTSFVKTLASRRIISASELAAWLRTCL